MAGDAEPRSAGPVVERERSGLIERKFRLAEHGTTVGRELLAGATTFAAMAYILVVNPNILKAAGMPQPSLVTATAIGSAAATLLMALMANLPLALAPGMGINVFFALTVCLGMGVPWQSALGLVFINGCVFLLLSLTGARERIMSALPLSLKAAVCAGIGLFIAFVGLKNGGLVVANPTTFVAMGDLSSPPVALFGGGILLTCALVARRIPGGIILSIAVVTVAGLFVSDGHGGAVTKLPPSAVSLPASIEPTLLKLNFDLVLSEPLKALPIILTLLLVDLFDNVGTLIGVTRRAGLMDGAGNVPGLRKALVADSLAAVLSSLLGTSTMVSYIESAAGVQSGGRTGLTTVATAACFLLALFFTPVFLMIPDVAVAPALVVVGILMFEAVADIDLRRLEVAAPAVLTLLVMPLTFSISTGIGIGLIALAALMPAGGRAKEVTTFAYGLALVFLLHFFEPAIHRLIQ